MVNQKFNKTKCWFNGHSNQNVYKLDNINKHDLIEKIQLRK